MDTDTTNDVVHTAKPNSKAGLLALLGGLLGYPLSYWLQSEMIQRKVPLSDYLGWMFEDAESFIEFGAHRPMLLTMAVLALVGFVIGRKT